jgi:hypothetical protein
MIKSITRTISVMALVGLAPMASAQETSDNRVAANTDWSVFVESNPTECWSVSAPKESRLTDSSGNATTGRRSDMLLFVFYRPGASVSGQVAFTGGYPFANSSTVSMDIGGTEYELFTEGEWAWPATPADDAKIVAAMKRGANAILKGRSGRGNVTTDTFSLLGFSAAIEEAARRCES